MYPEPQTMTLRELLIRISERFGVAEYSGTTPGPVADSHTLDRFKRGINDAVLELSARHSWSWLRPYVSITLSTDGTGSQCVGGSPVQYRLPAWVQGWPEGNVTWSNPSGTYGDKARPVHMDQVWALRNSRGSEKGPPAFIGVALDTTIQPEGKVPQNVLHIWPKPDLAHTIRPRFRRQATPLVGDHSTGCWTPVHDILVLEYAVCVLAESGVGNGPDAVTQRAKVERMLADHIRIDAGNSASSLGQMSYGPPPSNTIDRSSVVVYGTTVLD